MQCVLVHKTTLFCLLALNFYIEDKVSKKIESTKEKKKKRELN